MNLKCNRQTFINILHAGLAMFFIDFAGGVTFIRYKLCMSRAVLALIAVKLEIFK